MVGEETAQNIYDVIFRELDTVTVRGKRKQTKVYQPVCMKGDLNDALRDRLAAHKEALESYYAGDYAAARQLFEDLYRSSREDPYYARMIDTISKQTG